MGNSLEVIKNKLGYQSVPYEELISVAANGNVDVKKFITTLENWKNFVELDLDSMLGEQEGVVAVGEDGFMCKYKTSYYNHWKQMRKVVEQVSKGKKPSVENQFVNWILENKELSTKNIIELKELFEK